MANIVVVSGQFNSEKTSFADSPVIIEVSGLAWPTTSPFTVVRVNVVYDGEKVGEFKADTNGQTSIRFDISSALRTIWADYDFGAELAAAANKNSVTRGYRTFSLELYTEYLASDGYFVSTSSGVFSGGSCAIGGLTEMERRNIGNADMSTLEFSNIRYGDASTKPLSSPERIGLTSITSWVDLNEGGTTSHFFADTNGEDDGTSEHAPLVLRDSMPYTDFLFVNRRGAVETCSAHMLEALDIDVETSTYSRVERPTFSPVRSLMSVSKGGRRSWAMSSGHQTREWAEWWTLEFLMARRWWMLYQGPGMVTPQYVPVDVKPSKQQTSIYDRSKQQMPSVEFTVTLALEG